MSDKIMLTYCSNNPATHETTIFDRLVHDDKFDVQPPYCTNMCFTCDNSIYAIIGNQQSTLQFVQGKTEDEFLERLEKATGFDLSDYRNQE